MVRWLWLIALVACGHHAGGSQKLATIDGEVTALGVDATSLYVGIAQLGKPSIVKIAKSGGAEVLVTQTHNAVEGIVVIGDTLAWAELAIESHDGSGAITITADEISKAGGIARAASAGTDHPALIKTMPLAGGPQMEVARIAGAAAGLAADDTSFYLLSVGTWSEDGTIAAGRGSIIAFPRAGGAPRVIADHLVHAADLTVTPTTVMWTANGERWKIAKTGGTPTLIGKPRFASSPFDIYLADGTTVYRASRKPEGDTTTLSAIR